MNLACRIHGHRDQKGVAEPHLRRSPGKRDRVTARAIVRCARCGATRSLFVPWPPVTPLRWRYLAGALLGLLLIGGLVAANILLLRG